MRHGSKSACSRPSRRICRPASLLRPYPRPVADVPGTVAVRRSGRLCRHHELGQLDLNSDPEGAEVRHHCSCGSASGRFRPLDRLPIGLHYTVEYGAWRFTSAGAGSDTRAAPACSGRAEPGWLNAASIEWPACRPGERATLTTRAQSGCWGTDSWPSRSCSDCCAPCRSRDTLRRTARDADVLTQLQRLGAKSAASACRSCRPQRVRRLALLEDLDDLEAQLSGPSGLLAGVHSPTIVVFGGISSPDNLRNLSSDLVERTSRPASGIIDAPLSGTLATAAQGELAIAIGATRGCIAKLLPVPGVARHLRTCRRDRKRSKLPMRASNMSSQLRLWLSARRQ